MALITNSNSERKALVTPKPDVAPASEVATLQVSEPRYKTTTIDLAWMPKSNLLTHIEGSSWSIDYYAQVITTDSDLSGQQLSASGVYQSYNLIRDCEVKVTTPLSASQDDATKAMRVEGTAMLYPFIIPNEGDMFIASTLDGRSSVFRVTATNKKSVSKQACYEIVYSIDTEATDKINDLKKKVVQTYYYIKSFISYGQNPLVVKSDYLAYGQLEEKFYTLLRYYFKRFFSREFMTLTIPGQSEATYDGFLVDFLTKMFSTDQAPELIQLKKLNVEDDPLLKSDSLWTVLLSRNEFHLNTCFKRVGLVDCVLFFNEPLMYGLKYSGFKRIVYPTDAVLGADGSDFDSDNDEDDFGKEISLVGFEKTTPTPSVHYPAPAGQPTGSTGVEDEELDPTPAENPYAWSVQLQDPRWSFYKSWNTKEATLVNMGNIKPVAADDYYVLSRSFYERSENMSTLELLIWDYLDNKKVDVEQLVNTVKVVTSWGVLEQYYYIPLLLLLIKSTVRGL
jgi:hypothetical protein